MKLTKSAVLIDYKLVASFESVKQKLLRPKFADRWEKPLAYWVVATDRRLPLAFMGTSLRELLDTPLEELYATPGIGQKKIRTLINLLVRAAQAQPPGSIIPLSDAELEQAAAPATNGKRKGGEIDPAIVSEALWVQWRASIREHGFEHETLGRFVSSLQQLPRVIWNAPLGSYLDLSLAEIRALKTHGEKRVGAVLEVFGNLHQIVVHLGAQSHMGVRVLPRFVIRLENWVLRYLNGAGVPSHEELRTAFVAPLLEQVRIDAGPQIAKLVEGRFGAANSTVRHAAQRLGLTRARIYQLLGEAATIIKVRWPEGQALAKQLRERLASQEVEPAALELLDATIDLFFVAGAEDLPVSHAPKPQLAAEPKAAPAANGHSPANGKRQAGRKANGYQSLTKTNSR